MDRLLKKWETIKSYLPAPEYIGTQKSKFAMMYFGTSEYSSEEAADLLANDSIQLDLARNKVFSFPGFIKGIFLRT